METGTPGVMSSVDASVEASAIARAGRRQRRLVAIMFISGLVVFAISLIGLASMSASLGVADVSDVVFLLIWLVVAAVMIASGIRLHRWWQRAEELVPAHDGLVCPKCVLPVEAVADSPAQARCGKCARRYEPAALQQYWNMFVTKPNEALRFLAQALARDNTAGGRASKFLLAAIGDYRTTLVFLLIVWIGMSVALGSMGGRGIVTGMLTYLPMMLMMIGLSVLFSGCKQRKGTESRCAQCGYQRVPGSTAAAQEKCPECAAAWNQVGGVTHGEARRRPGLMMTGALCALAGIFFISSQFTLGFNALTKALPTSVLIDQVSEGFGFIQDQWAELRTRDLSPEQTIALAEAVLERRLCEGFLWADDDNWFVAQITAKSLPGDLVERYYSEAVELSLSGPDTGRAGEPMWVMIDGGCRSAASNNPIPVVLFAGFFVGDDPTPQQRLPHTVSALQFCGRSRRPANAPPMSRPGVPSLSLTPSQPGPLRIRLECWIAYVPPGPDAPITWNDDGTPVTPAGAVWMERRSLEHIVNVSE